MSQNNAIVFRPSSHGQEVVANGHCSRRERQILNNNEFELLQSLVPTLRLGRARRSQEVRAVEPAHLQSVRLIRLHSVQRFVGLRGCHARGQTRPGSSANTLGPNLVAHCTALFHAPFAQKCRGGTQGQTTRTIDRTRQSSQNNEGLGQLNAVFVLIEGKTPCPANRTLGANDVRHALDIFNRNRGNLGDLLYRIFSRASLDVVKTENPLLGELVIVLVVLEQKVHDAQGQARVGLRTNLQVDVAVVSTHPRNARVDRDDLRAKLHHVNQAVTEETVAVGRQRLFTPNNNPLGKRVTRIVIATRQVSRVVKFGIACAQNVVGNGATRTVARPTRLGVAAVRRLQNRERQGIIEDASLATGAAKANNGLRAVILLEIANLFADGVNRFIPRGALPLHFAAVFGIALHGVDDARRRIRILAKCQVHSVNAARGNGVIIVALHANQFPIFRDNLHAVSDGMASRR